MGKVDFSLPRPIHVNGRRRTHKVLWFLKIGMGLGLHREHVATRLNQFLKTAEYTKFSRTRIESLADIVIVAMGEITPEALSLITYSNRVFYVNVTKIEALELLPVLLEAELTKPAKL